MSVKGCVRVPNPVTEDVLRAIAQMGDQEEFGIKEVHARLLHRTQKQITSVLQNKFESGALDRIGRGRYRKGGTRMKTRIPAGVVTEAVWAVLFTDPDCQPIPSTEIVGEVEVLTGRSVNPTSVRAVLTCWHRDEHLERFGKKREYAYRLKDGVTQQPPCLNNP